jgi:hypothetical protein
VNCRLPKEAEADIARILRRTKKLFGAVHVSTHAKIIEGRIAMIADDPVRGCNAAFYSCVKWDINSVFFGNSAKPTLWSAFTN